ncbi:MAG: leucine-rich repeat domain-containing protein [Bacteroidia bacterium]
MRLSPKIKWLFVLPLFVALKLSAQAPIEQPNLIYPLMDSLALDTVREFTSIEEAMKNPEQVIRLSLRKQRLKTIPKEVYLFPNLQYLDLSKNQIEEVSDSIGMLTNLQVLILSKNKIQGLPRELGDLYNLRILNINQNELMALPPQIGKLKKLEILDLWSNNLSMFPEELKQLSGSLKVLDLRVILINQDQQNHIRAMLPSTTIYFSPPCKCNQ